MKENKLKRLEFMVSLFEKITAGILFVTALYISIFYGWDFDIQVEVLWQILILSIICTLGSFFLPIEEEKEVPRNAMLIRMVLYYVYINIVVLACGFYFGWFSFSQRNQVLGMAAAIAFVFAVVLGLSYWQGSREAGRMNRKLEEREQK